MADLGFNPENVIPVITPVMKMFVQANTPLTEQDLRTTIGTLDIIAVSYTHLTLPTSDLV